MGFDVSAAWADVRDAAECCTDNVMCPFTLTHTLSCTLLGLIDWFAALCKTSFLFPLHLKFGLLVAHREDVLIFLS